eukprot:scaffold546_cov352-Prasinococcus_capsulatus_cf.AAC.17
MDLLLREQNLPRRGAAWRGAAPLPVLAGLVSDRARCELHLDAVCGARTPTGFEIVHGSEQPVRLRCAAPPRARAGWAWKYCWETRGWAPREGGTGRACIQCDVTPNARHAPARAARSMRPLLHEGVGRQDGMSKYLPVKRS